VRKTRGLGAPKKEPEVLSLEQLQALKIFENQKTVAYKTVDLFAGLTKRKLWLKDGRPCTDGNEISAPFDDPNFYRLLEHELAHILFRTDITAAHLFVSSYADKILAFGTKNGVLLDRAALAYLLRMLTGLLEDQRVDSLWGRLYPGSYLLMQRMNKQYAVEWLPQVHDSVVALMAVISGKQEIPPGKLDAFVPLMREALAKVEQRGFAATLAVAKWLITRLVDLLISEAEQQEKDASGSGSDPAQGASNGAGTGASGGAKGVAQVRLQALQILLDISPEVVPPGKIPSVPNDVQLPKFQSREAKERAAATAKAAESVADKPEELEKFLQQSAREMEKLIQDTRSAIRNLGSADDWLKKDARAKLKFHDIAPSATQKVELSLSDVDTVRRLRSIFNRVMGQRKTLLEDTGMEVDPAAYIERKTSGVAVPCFRHEDLGRGFKALLLMDRSGSMYGDKTVQVLRASNIITKAMTYPFVTCDVWGFQSLDHGQVDITRFPSTKAALDTRDLKIHGGTPLHVAIRIAIRHMEAGFEVKQLIVVTDGFPTFGKKTGESFGTPQLMQFVRAEVLRARMKGINVTCALIGREVFFSPAGEFDISDANMGFMFGERKNWKKLNPKTFGRDLVNLMAASFVEYLASN
jgi:hypothetical protein